MTYRSLGRNGPMVSAVGLGTWPLAGGMGAVDSATAIDTIHAALDTGMTFIDTAEGYRESEQILGRALSGVPRDSYFMATKVTGKYHAADVRRAAENSLRALGIDQIDLYQIHSYPSDVPLEETLGETDRLQVEGKIRFVGVSNFTVEQLAEARNLAPIVSNQVNYSMYLRTVEDRMLPYCRDKGVALVIHSTLAKGLLTGKHSAGHVFAADDERSRFESYGGKMFDRYLAAAAALKPVADSRGISVVELAIAWTLRHPEVCTALVGPKSSDQVTAPGKAGGISLTQEEIEQIESVLGAHDLPPLAPWKSQIV